jgi:inorganic pyrophosphatase
MNTFNPWHNVEVGEQQPDVVNAIIEISKGSRAKYEIDKVTGMLKLDRVLFSSFHYPTNYGFIPRSLGDDGDPLDILVLSQIDIEPLCIVRSKVVGVMRMIDRGKGDDKIIAVAADDVSVSHIDGLESIPEHFRLELRNFFEEYTKLENKAVLVEEFQDAATAKTIITEAIANYSLTMP